MKQIKVELPPKMQSVAVADIAEARRFSAFMLSHRYWHNVRALYGGKFEYTFSNAIELTALERFKFEVVNAEVPAKQKG